MKKLLLYSIMGLDTDHVEEICEDIRQQYEMGVSNCPLFSMTLVPEGNPPVNKAALLCGKYKLFQKRLKEMGIPSGILVQATIGHGWVLSEMFPFQQVEGVKDGALINTVCPYDEGFHAYLYDAFRTIAEAAPDFFMVDDDFRLLARPGFGCGCPLHRRRFAEKAGVQLEREALWQAISSKTEEGRRYAEIFVETQRESLLSAARVMRQGIDSVDPTLPGSFCCVGSNAEFADEIAKILVGEGNPVVVRINNGRYTSAGPRFFSNTFYQAATQREKLKKRGVDVILAETDTCPQNRYSTGAMSLHTHFTGTILEGAAGAKHWITRLAAFEPESGKAYRRVLSKYAGFYEALAETVPHLTYDGCRIPLRADPDYRFGDALSPYETGLNHWCACVFERMGIPVYFSSEKGGVLCLEGVAADCLSDAQIKEALGDAVLLSSDALLQLEKRGFGEFLGVTARPWQGKQITGETLFVNGNGTACQKGTLELVPDARAQVDSMVYHSVDKTNKEPLFPGSVIYENALGGKVFTFAGSPDAPYGLGAAFSFLNYSRKKQLIRMLDLTDHLPLYYPGDEEVYLRVGKHEDGSTFCALFNIGMDPIEMLTIVSKNKYRTAEILTPEGSYQRVALRRVEEDLYEIDTPAFPLHPVVLRLS